MLTTAKVMTQPEARQSAIQKWTTLSSKRVFDHRWYRLRQDTVALPNGQIVDDYFVSLRPDIATVLPITADGQVVFVRQYRHGIGEILADSGHSGADCLRRDLCDRYPDSPAARSANPHELA